MDLPGHERLLELLRIYSKGDLKGKRILVIGDNVGHLTSHLLTKLGMDAYGINMSGKKFADSLEAVKEGRLIAGNAMHLREHFGDQKFDFVVSNATMSPQGLGAGRFGRIIKKHGLDRIFLSISEGLLLDRLRWRAYAKTSSQIHRAVFAQLNKGGLAIHVVYENEEIPNQTKELASIGFGVLHRRNNELVLRRYNRE
ncbi:MAG: hypothetical protein AABX01_06590 [Candidatus Micrarchaeota archaeon]